MPTHLFRLPPILPPQQLEDLGTLKSCLGWQLESAAEDVVSSKVRLHMRLTWPAQRRRSMSRYRLPLAECAQHNQVRFHALQVALRLADLFRLRLDIGSRVEAAAAVEVLPGARGRLRRGPPSCVGAGPCRREQGASLLPPCLLAASKQAHTLSPQPLLHPNLPAEAECKVPADCRALLSALAGCPEDGAGPAPELRVAEPTGPKVAALVQATTARLSRLGDLAAELDGLRLVFPSLTDVSCSAGEEGWGGKWAKELERTPPPAMPVHLPAALLFHSSHLFPSPATLPACRWLPGAVLCQLGCRGQVWGQPAPAGQLPRGPGAGGGPHLV